MCQASEICSITIKYILCYAMLFIDILSKHMFHVHRQLAIDVHLYLYIYVYIYTRMQIASYAYIHTHTHDVFYMYLLELYVINLCVFFFLQL